MLVFHSDIVVQIVDARNPLLFRCEDLEKYVTEVSPHKRNMILLNKADFLTPEQREAWTTYFNSINVRVAFFSATLAAEELDEGEEEEEDKNVTESCLLSRRELIKLFRQVTQTFHIHASVSALNIYTL